MSQSSSRRDFIKQVGAGAAVLGAGIAATPPADARPHTVCDGPRPRRQRPAQCRALSGAAGA